MRATRAQDARLVVVVDLIERVGRFVIVVVSSGPEEEHRNLFRIERRVIAWTIAIFIERQLESPR